MSQIDRERRFAHRTVTEDGFDPESLLGIDSLDPESIRPKMQSWFGFCLGSQSVLGSRKIALHNQKGRLQLVSCVFD